MINKIRNELFKNLQYVVFKLIIFRSIKIRYEKIIKVQYVVFYMNIKIRNEKIIKAHYVFFVEKILIFLYNNTIKNHLIQK